MSPRQFAIGRHRHDTDTASQPSSLGMFMVSMELLVAAMLLAIGIHFLTVATEPDAVAYGMFVAIVLLMFDVVRRVINIARGKAPA
ncbi:hypothetical protein [Enteractinococcus helveticum]|uniref:Uncharacterized protein n=1 Tax=Enteractinococcus helveticum TaxID=1837282 RepID=A0A1B7M2U9_9MICC|nr:hypothetical protein [Enteractinococcus helveticum]OAV62895.1 hypothetical protein A6F49_04360 [Enteractinococcus helveticum]